MERWTRRGSRQYLPDMATVNNVAVGGTRGVCGMILCWDLLHLGLLLSTRGEVV